ncbi:MAG: IS1634 family transposase [bacterium]|nr:IS1634 family transposase [bacterium]
MFFREKYSNTSKNPIIQLVENYRIGAKVKQRIIVSLGSEVVIPKKFRKKVAKSIEEKLLGIQSVWEDSEITKMSEPIVRKIQSEGKWSSLRNVNSLGKNIKSEKETAEVYVDDLNHKYTRELGPCLLAHVFWQRLNFDKILLNCGFKKNQLLTAQLSVLNRLIAGDNENNILTWIKTSAIADLLGTEVECVGKDRFYRISDKLLSHKEEIEIELYKSEKKYFGFENTLVLYDLTNSYFEGESARNPKVQYSKNQKEKRTDCPQIVVALILDGEGFVRRHFTFEGKMSDGKSLSSVLESFKDEFKFQENATVVIDKGIANDDNIKLIRDTYSLNYIVASQGNEEKQFADIFATGEFTSLKKDKKNEVKIHIEKQDDITYLLCKSSGRAKKELSMRNNRELRFEDDLLKLQKRISTGGINSPKDVHSTIGRIRERHKKVAHYYDIEYNPFKYTYTLPEDENKISKRVKKMLLDRKKKALTYKMTYLSLAKDMKGLKQKYPEEFKYIKTTVIEPSLRWNIKKEKASKRDKLEGNYVLKTNRKDLTDSQMWKTYVMLTKVEKAFRNLKTDLALRPNPHHLEERVDGHIFISILAYHLLHAIEFTLHQKGMNVWWSSIKRVMSSHCYSTIIAPTVKGTVINVRKPGIPEQIHVEIYDKLNIDYTNLKKTKIYV